MALDFYAFHPPEDVPNYCEVEQMSDATLETFPRYYLEWIGVAMDQKAAEVEGTYRLVDLTDTCQHLHHWGLGLLVAAARQRPGDVH